MDFFLFTTLKMIHIFSLTSSQIQCNVVKEAFQGAGCCENASLLVDLSHYSPPAAPPAPPPPTTNSDLTKLMINAGLNAPGGVMAYYGQKSIDLTLDMMVGDASGLAFPFGWFRPASELSLNQNSNEAMNINLFYQTIQDRCDETIEYGSSDINVARASVLKGYAIAQLAFLTNTTVDAKLTEAAQLLESSITTLTPFRRSDVSEIDASVATVLLANIKALQGEWDDVISLLSSFISHHPDYRVMNSDEILRMTNVHALRSSVIWGYDLQPSDNIASLATLFGFLDINIYGYQWANHKRAMNKKLYDAMTPSDQRRAQFYNLPTNDTYYESWHLTQSNKFTPTTQDGTKVIGNTESRMGIPWDYIFIRYSEVLLLLAEAHAQRGDDGATVSSVLGPLLEARLSQQDSYQLKFELLPSMTQSELKNFVFQEWRREFWAEGKVYFAMKRLGQSITRDNRTVYLKEHTIAHDDHRLTIPLFNITI